MAEATLMGEVFPLNGHVEMQNSIKKAFTSIDEKLISIDEKLTIGEDLVSAGGNITITESMTLKEMLQAIADHADPGEN